MQNLFLDFETFSREDLIKKGLDRYAKHPSTRVLMLAYAFDNQPVQQWFPYQGDMPTELKEALTDPLITKRAFNASFELAIFESVLKIAIPIEQVKCTKVLCLSLTLPGSLDKAGKAVNLSDEVKKMAEGKRLIRKFSVPKKPTLKKPNTVCNRFTDYDDWSLFCEYNRRDVEAERAIFNKLKNWDLPNSLHKEWVLDQKINKRGIPINRAAVKNAVEVLGEHTEITYDAFKELTGLDNPNSVSQFLPWLVERDYPYEDLTAKNVAKAYDKEISEEVTEALGYRKSLSQSSVKKYSTILHSISEDDTLKYAFEFLGASRTGRFAGRRFQPQNIKKADAKFEKIQNEIAFDLEHLDYSELMNKYDDVAGVLSSAVRTVVQAPKGKTLLDADLSAIENRVIGWLCDDDKILSVFREGRCPYVDFATYLFNEDYEVLYLEYKSGNKKKRNLAKPAVLGAGFGLGAGQEYEDEKTGEIKATGLLGYALNMGIKMTLEESEMSIKIFRQVYEEVVSYWKTIEKAAIGCVRTGQSTTAGKIVFAKQGPFLVMQLPSGRNIYYFKPELKAQDLPWGGQKAALSYLNLNEKGQFERIGTYGGKLVENAVQALARDILVHGLLEADKRGLDICMHVHDQIVCVSDESDADEDLQVLISCMEKNPSWCLDMPLKAEGHHNFCFIKD